jgi:hypothetical protein
MRASIDAAPERLWQGSTKLRQRAVLAIYCKPCDHRQLHSAENPMRIARMVTLLPLLAFMASCNGWPFIKVNRRVPQSECKGNLKALYTAQRALHQERDNYSELIEDTGFVPERGNKYAYFLSMGGPLSDRRVNLESTTEGARGIGVDVFKHGPGAEVVAAQLPTRFAGGVMLGVSGTCPKCDFVAACAGNIDKDPDLDVWSIASFDRTATDGSIIPKGTPWCEKDDR